MFRDLIPTIIKMQDNEISPNVFQDLVDVLEEEYNTISSLIDDLSKLVDPDETSYRKYLLESVKGRGFAAGKLKEGFNRHPTAEKDRTRRPNPAARR